MALSLRNKRQYVKTIVARKPIKKYFFNVLINVFTI